MLNTSNQEHGVVYNIIRLADFLLRCTGEVQYSDYSDNERGIRSPTLDVEYHCGTGSA